MNKAVARWGTWNPAWGPSYKLKLPPRGGYFTGNGYVLTFWGLIMRKDIRALFEQFKRTSFPDLGQAVGDFALYDSLMAGTISSFLEGAKISPAAIPAPDHETEEVLRVLKRKAKPTKQETDFLKYAQLLGELRVEIAKAANAA